MADVEGFVNGRLLMTGRSRRRAEFNLPASAKRRVLVIDDSINWGHSMLEVRRIIQRAGISAEVFYCAVYGAEPHHAEVDIVLEYVPQPRIFQWNVMHHAFLEHSCVDIDGVLCCDPDETANDDGAKYLSFLQNAVPLLVPRCKIGWLVTSRLEKYRDKTEAWLRSWGIEYGELRMLDLPSKEERIRLGNHAIFKASVYRDVGAVLFIESDHWQAEEIAKISGKPVLCIESQQMIEPSRLSPLMYAQKLRTLPRRLRLSQSPVSRLTRRSARRILGDENFRQLKALLARLRGASNASRGSA
jgi:uncharacterized HAD superfamily protein